MFTSSARSPRFAPLSAPLAAPFAQSAQSAQTAAQLQYLLDQHQEQEQDWSGWGNPGPSGQWGGGGDDDGGARPAPSWSAAVRATTARVLDLPADVPDADLVRAFRKQLSLHEWAPFVIREVLRPPARYIEEMYRRTSTSSPAIFKYAWLYSVAMTHGRELANAPPGLVFSPTQGPGDLEQRAHQTTMSLAEFAQWYDDTEGGKNPSTGLVRSFRSRSYHRVGLYLNFVGRRMTIPFLWPCVNPALSPRSFLQYLLFDLTEQDALRFCYYVLPSSMMETVGSVPHEIDLRDTDDLFGHDVEHLESWANSGRESALVRETPPVVLKRAVHFLQRPFQDAAHALIQHWCTEYLFLHLHENFARARPFDGWRHLFIGPDRVRLLTNSDEPGENELERLFLGRAVQLLGRHVRAHASCQAHTNSLFDVVDQHFLVPYEAVSHVQDSVVRKLFGDEPPLTLIGTVMSGQAQTERQRVEQQFPGAVMRAVAEGIECLVHQTPFAPEDAFDWDLSAAPDDHAASVLGKRPRGEDLAPSDRATAPRATLTPGGRRRPSVRRRRPSVRRRRPSARRRRSSVRASCDRRARRPRFL